MTLPTLQLLAAKALPELLYALPTDSIVNTDVIILWRQPNQNVLDWFEVTDREWLWICGKLCKRLNQIEWSIYNTELIKICGSAASAIHATTAQRLEAWARTKGVYVE